MSPLPQRKKSPEEIARLRESLGVPQGPGQATDAAEAAPANPADTLVPHIHQADVVHPEPPAPLSPLPGPVEPGPKPVHSLKRSERALHRPPPEHPPAAAATPVSAPAAVQPAAQPTADLRPVRSLKKSEQAAPSRAVRPLEPAGDPKIPFRRHSDEELNEIRRREALAMLNATPPNPRLAVAHPVMIAPGYLFATVGGSCFVFDEFPLAATAACAAAALLVATLILLLRPLSRHHAAFITVIALLVIVFGALHYFPHLRHAT